MLVLQILRPIRKNVKEKNEINYSNLDRLIKYKQIDTTYSNKELLVYLTELPPYYNSDILAGDKVKE